MHLQQLCRSLKLLEQKSIHPLRWCRNMSLCVTELDEPLAHTAGTSDLLSIFFACNNLRDVELYVRFREDSKLGDFRPVWGLMLGHLSKQRNLRVDLTLDTEPALAAYDYPFDDLHSSLVRLTIITARSLTECIPRGELSKFEHLESLRIHPDSGDAYTAAENSLCWKEIGQVQLKHLNFFSRRPALKWDNHESAILPSTLETIHISCRDYDGIDTNPIELLKQKPDLRSLSLTPLYDRTFANENERDNYERVRFPLPSPSCQLCRQQISATYCLTRLVLEINCPSAAFREIVSGCPMIEDLVMPSCLENDDLLCLVSKCKLLRELDFSCWEAPYENCLYTAHGLAFLCEAKQLTHVSTNCLPLERIMPVLEHWAVNLAALKWLYVGGFCYCQTLEDRIKSCKDKSWEALTRNNHLNGYGTTAFCCLEEEARAINLPNVPRWSSERRAEMVDWISGFVGRRGRREFIDMAAMRSDLMDDNSAGLE